MAWGLSAGEDPVPDASPSTVRRLRGPDPGWGAELPLVAVSDTTYGGDLGWGPWMVFHPGPQLETPPEAGWLHHPVAHSSSGRSPDTA